MRKFVHPHYLARCATFPEYTPNYVAVNPRREVSSSGRVPNSNTLYDVLGLPQDCSRKEIKLAFVKLSKELHPDRNQNDPSYHVKFVELNEAYAVLVRQESRRRYDFFLAERLRNPAAADTWSGANAGSPSRTANPDSSFGTNYDYGFWETRDKSQDRFYEGKPYYGVKGVKRLPHWYIVLGCCVFILAGATGHYFVILWGNRVSREAQDKKDAINSKFLAESRQRAAERSSTQQLEWLVNLAEKKKDE